MEEYPATRHLAFITHPGEHLREDTLPALGMTPAEFAAHLGIEPNALAEILGERAPITLDIAMRLGKALGNGARFWLALQFQHDVWMAERLTVDVERINWEPSA